MNEPAILVERIKSELPDVEVEFNTRTVERGFAFLSFYRDDYTIHAEWRRGLGFGLSGGTDFVFGEGPHEVYTDRGDVHDRVVELLNSREATKPPDELALAKLRVASRLSQDELARRLGVGQATVSKIERQSDMYLSTLERFVRAMGGELELFAKFASSIVRISSPGTSTESTKRKDGQGEEGRVHRVNIKGDVSGHFARGRTVVRRADPSLHADVCIDSTSVRSEGPRLQYEVVYILNPEMSENDQSSLRIQLEGIVHQFNGTVERYEFWGTRRLAYDVAGKTEGVYALIVATGSRAMSVEIDRHLKGQQGVLRHLIVRVANEPASTQRHDGLVARRRVSKYTSTEEIETSEEPGSDFEDDILDVRDTR